MSSEVCIKSEDAVLLCTLDVGLLVLAYTLLEEVSLASEGDHVHPLEGVGCHILQVAQLDVVAQRQENSKLWG